MSKHGLFIGIALIVLGALGVLGIIFSGYLLGWSGGQGGRSPGGTGSERKTTFSSNGERIYLTGESKSGKPITSRTEGMGGHMVGNMTCADCHGERRQGGRIDLMMVGSYKVPEVTAEHLEEHGYTDSQLKRAITKGLSPEGEKLKFPMPRWSMAEEDLDDLVKFLRSK